MKVTLLIPVRNEIDCLGHILPRLRKEWVDEILFIDGHSTDGTKEFLEQNGYRVMAQKSEGLQGIYWECLDKVQGDAIIAFSPDGNCNPQVIPEIVRKLKEGHDLVIASRYLGGAKSEDDDGLTRFGNWMFTRLINLLFRGHYTDTLVIFRGFRRDIADILHMDEKTTPIFEIHLMIRALKCRLKIAEVFGHEAKRIGGARKMRIWYHGWQVAKVIAKELFSKTPKPLDLTPAGSTQAHG